MKTVFLSIIFTIVYLASTACSCLPPVKINENEYSKYDLIFTGKVLKVSSAGNFQQAILFKLTTFYKGVITVKKITVFTAENEAICGINFIPGQQWLIFANKKDTIFFTGLCTRSKILNPTAPNYRKDAIEEDLQFLEVKKKKD